MYVSRIPLSKRVRIISGVAIPVSMVTGPKGIVRVGGLRS